MYKMFTHTDLDGVGCAVLAKIMHRNHGNEEIPYNIDIEYLNYNNCDEIVSNFFLNDIHNNYDFIYITDLALKQTTLEIINSKCSYDKVIVIDHHKTSTFYNNYPFAFMIGNIDGKAQCGTSLFYNYAKNIIYNEYEDDLNGIFYDGNIKPKYKIKEYIDLMLNGDVYSFDPIKYFVESVRLYDVWEWQSDKLHLSSEFNILFDLYNPKQLTDLFVNLLLTNPFEMTYSYKTNNIINMLVLNKMDYIDKAIKNSIITNIDGHVVAVAFAEKHQSQIGNLLVSNNDVDYAMIINLANRSISFRSVGDFDVSEIAKKYGGGGHKNASGATIDTDKMISIILEIAKR